MARPDCRYHVAMANQSSRRSFQKNDIVCVPQNPVHGFHIVEVLEKRINPRNGGEEYKVQTPTGQTAYVESDFVTGTASEEEVKEFQTKQDEKKQARKAARSNRPKTPFHGKAQAESQKSEIGPVSALPLPEVFSSPTVEVEPSRVEPKRDTVIFDGAHKTGDETMSVEGDELQAVFTDGDDPTAEQLLKKLVRVIIRCAKEFNVGFASGAQEQGAENAQALLNSIMATVRKRETAATRERDNLSRRTDVLVREKVDAAARLEALTRDQAELVRRAEVLRRNLGTAQDEVESLSRALVQEQGKTRDTESRLSKLQHQLDAVSKDFDYASTQNEKLRSRIDNDETVRAQQAAQVAALLAEMRNLHNVMDEERRASEQQVQKALTVFWENRRPFYDVVHRGLKAMPGRRDNRLEYFRREALKADVQLLVDQGCTIQLLGEATGLSEVPYDGSEYRWYDMGDEPVLNGESATVLLPGWTKGFMQVKPLLGRWDGGEN